MTQLTSVQFRLWPDAGHELNAYLKSLCYFWQDVLANRLLAE